MHALSLLLLLATPAAGHADREREAPFQADLLIDHVTLVSPERAAPLPDAWVAIRDGAIVAVGSAPERSAWSAAKTLNGRGRTLTPGLIDSHVHLASLPGLPLAPTPELRPHVEAYERQLPRSYLYFGFTALVDLNVVDRPALERFRRAPHHPDLFDCGGALALANGYPMVFFPPARRFEAFPNFLLDPARPASAPGFDPADHTPEAAAGRVVAGGGICLKTFVEDGFGNARTWPIPSGQLLRQVVAAGRQRNLAVTMHANSFEAWRLAVDSGTEVLVHGLWNWDGLQAAEGLPEPLRLLLDEVIERDIAVMPTMQVLAGLQSLFDPDFLDRPEIAAAVPSAMLSWYRSKAGGWFREQLRAENLGGSDDAAAFAALANGLENGEQVLRYLESHGARLLLGSDTPSAPTYANPPGLNGFLEMRRWAAAGVSPRRILGAATLGNARAFHLEDRFGTIEAGKVANLLLLDADPLKSVEAWGSIEIVVLRGEILQRSELAASALE